MMNGFEKMTGMSKKKTHRGSRGKGKGKGSPPPQSNTVMPAPGGDWGGTKPPLLSGSKKVLWKALQTKSGTKGSK